MLALLEGVGRTIVWVGLLAAVVIAGASYPTGVRAFHALVANPYQAVILGGPLEDYADLAGLVLLATLGSRLLIGRIMSVRAHHYRADANPKTFANATNHLSAPK